MQNIKIPVTIDPIRAAAKKLDYEGIIDKNDLRRFPAAVVSVCDNVNVSLTFYKDLSGINIIEGKAQVKVVMQCQRCSEDFELDIDTEFKYSPDKKHLEELDLIDEFDTVDLNSFGEIDLYDIIEDELILSLPLIAKHSEEDCPATDMIESLSGNEQDEEGRHSPFAILGDLIKDRNK